MKIKSLVAGFIAGVFAMGTVTAFALTLGSGKVDAYIQDGNVSIIINGEYVNIPSDTHIINVENRVYTPARVVAEKLGATVTWEEARRAVVIDMPEKIVEKVETVEVFVPEYSPLPLRRVKENFEIAIVDYDIRNKYFDVVFDYRYDSNEVAILNVKNSYVEVDGEKYDFFHSSKDFDSASIVPGEDFQDIVLTFEKIPDGAKKVKLIIPVEYWNSGSVKETVKYEFNFLLDK